uniref:Small RNA 2'-O-methyltransferase n=1 Tax=Anopheles christyi TaxID=43041 RepID=A0A182K245_9DIPT
MMSGDDFIYSAIADDNMNAFDLNVIASTLASTDKLVRQNKQQKEENDRLVEKISSLRESALQIKTLYEAELAKGAKAEAQLATYVSQCKQLEERCLIADSDKINADLILMERLAEKDRQQEQKEHRYQSLITDLIRYFSLPCDPIDSSKKRELKQHMATVDLLNLPDDVKAFIQQAPNHRSKRRKGRTKSAAMVDQECQTAPVEMRHGSTNTDQLCTERPEWRDCGTDAMEMEILPKEPQELKEQPASKTFCDKATMHSMSTITRSTCTSVFIKHVDVGVNFPEVTHKSVDEILRECVPLPPLLLSPIAEILPQCESVGTQTEDPVASVELVEKSTFVTCGTMTNLKNIRKRIDYRTVDGGMTPFQQQYTSVAEQLFGKIKKEDYPSSPGFGFDTDDALGTMHPHLSTIWTLLGESIFMLLSSGRRFDSQCYNMLNEQLTTIRDMIEADGRRESEFMSTMFSNVRATVVAAAGYGKERGATTVTPNVATAGARGPREAGTPPQRTECSTSPVDDCGVVIVVEKETEVVPASPTKEISNSDAEVVLVERDTVSASSPELQITRNANDESRIQVAQSTATSGTEAAPKHCNEEKEQNSVSLPLPSSLTPEKTPPALDEEVDRIALQLQIMEEGEEDLPTVVENEQDSASPPAPSANDNTPPKQATSAIEKDTLEVTSVPELEMASANLITPAEQLPSVPRPTTPPSEAIVTCNYYPPSTSETFVSPIKVKETNQLVKDQFKTPTQPPISKRKLRIRRSDETSLSPSVLPHASKRLRLSSPEPNTGRVSPTTEFLLEDDWDQKFSSIKAAMMGSLTDVHSKPLSPIADRCEELIDLDLEKQVDDDETVPMEAEDIASKETSETVSPVIATVTSVSSNIDRIEEEEKKTTDSSNKQKDVEKLSEDNPSVERRITDVGNQLEVITVATVQQEQVAVDESLSENTESSTKDVTDGDIDDDDDGEIMEDQSDDLNSTGELTIDIETDPLPNENCDPVWDSPMSPPAHETGLSVSTYCPYPIVSGTESPLSPPLASDRESTTTVPPPRIPLFHVALHQQLQQQAHDRKEPIYKFIALYDTQKWQEKSQKATGRTNPQEQQVLKKLSEIIGKYLQDPEWTETVVNDTLTAVLDCTHDVRLIALAMLEMVISCADISLNVICSPPAPPLPLTQQKLILVVRHLGYGLATLEDVLMRELDRRMFQLKSNTLPVPAMIALTFLYIGMEDSKPSEMPWKRLYNVRLYIFKCMYYFGFKCLPLVYYVLRAFPFALPKKGSPHYDNADAMIATIRTILMNVNYNENCIGSPDASLYRKRELVWLLRNTYGYQLMSPTYEELVANLVEKIRANKLRNVAHSLILVAKRNGYDWARLHIIQKRIYPLLNDYLKQFELMRASSSIGGAGSSSLLVAIPGSSSGSSAGNSSTNTLAGSLDDRIVACIFTIASIMKTQPSNEDASRVMQIFTTIVQLAEGNRAIQEEAIAGLIKFSRFGFVDVFQRLSSWIPGYPISDRIKLMLTTMINRKPPQFWKQLMENRIIDIDERILRQCRNLVQPLLADHLSPPVKPLTVEVWRGNIAESHECLEGTDAVIGIEIIEHLHQPVLDKVPENVFGFIKPKVAFFSTPNAEYNVLFDGLLENGFRHDDHKFEWSRAQFVEWAESICQRYPDYAVKYFGIGPAPAGSEQVGCVSQLAVFVRHDFINSLPPVALPKQGSIADDSPEDDNSSAQTTSTTPARPQLVYDQQIGEVVLVKPPQCEPSGEPANSGNNAVGEPLNPAGDDVVAEQRWREYDDLIDDLDNGNSDDDFDYSGGAGYGDEEDGGEFLPVLEMHIPEEEARAMRTRNDSGNFEEEEQIEPDREYWLITSEVYPVAAPDDRSHEQRIRDAAEYQVRRLRNFGDDFLAPEQDRYLVPLSAVYDCMGMELTSMEEVRQVLIRANYRIGEQDMIVLPLEDEEEDDSDEGRIDDYGEYDMDDQYVPWQVEDEETAKASQGVIGMTLEDCDETWD